MSFRHLFATLALLTSLAPAGALAQPTDASRSLARTLANEGYDALERRDYTTAVERFRRADALFHVPTVALGLARAEAGLLQLVQAEETYRRIVREGAPAGAPPPIVKAVADARREVDALAPRIPGVIISVTGAGGAQVTLDGAPVSAAALGVRLPLNPGMHLVRASAPGFRPAETTLMFVEGKSPTVTLELRAEGPVPAIVPVRPPPKAAPALGPPAPLAGPVGPSPDRAPQRWPAQRVAGVALMGVGAVGAVVGGVLAAQAHAKFADLAKQCPSHKDCDPGLGSELSSYHTLGNASLGAFIAGGALLGTGIVVFVTAPKPGAPAGAFIAPRVGAGYAGIEGGF